MSSTTGQRVRTVSELYRVMCIQATPAEWMRQYLFDQPPTMPAQEAWENCPDEVAMVYVAGLLGVPSEVLVGIAIECARVVVEHGLPEAAEFLRLAEEFQPGERFPVGWQSRFDAAAQVAREMDASEISYMAKLATSSAHSVALATSEAAHGYRGRMLDRACEAVFYASDATDDSHDAVLAIVRERLTWSVMAEQLEGLWPEEADASG